MRKDNIPLEVSHSNDEFITTLHQGNVPLLNKGEEQSKNVVSVLLMEILSLSLKVSILALMTLSLLFLPAAPRVSQKGL